MKLLTAILLFLLLFFSLSCVSQEQKIFITFIPDHDNFLDCYTVYAANDLYTINTQPFYKIEIPGTKRIDPSANLQDPIMITYADQSIMKNYGSFEFPLTYYVDLSHEEANAILLKNDSRYKSYVKYDFTYYANAGLYAAPKEVTEYQQQEINEKVKLEEIEEQKQMEKEAAINGGPINVPNIGFVYDVYIHEVPRFVQLTSYFTGHPTIRDSVNLAFESARELIQPLIDSILQPFYMSEFEVTNKEYREFVEYVRDSIALYIAYNLTEDLDHAFTLLNVSKKELKVNCNLDKEAKLKKYGLRMPKQNIYSTIEFIPALAEMYYPQPERYYKRHEFDVRKFNYHQNDSVVINVYPDTLGFKKTGAISKQHELFVNMYFWHPAFDNYPLVNVSYNQIMAFCHWKEQQINKLRKPDSLWISVSPPTIRQYEFALKSSQSYVLTHKAHDFPNNHFVSIERDSSYSTFFLNKVYGGDKSDDLERNEISSAELLNYMNWYKANQNTSFPFLNGNVSEIVIDKVNQETLNFYGLTSNKSMNDLHYTLGSNYETDVKVLGDDQYNAIFYKTLGDKSKSNCTSGFRLVYTVKKM